MRKHISEIIEFAKCKPCVDCGIELPTAVMEFDHVRGKKLFNVTSTVVCSMTEILAEIEKCDVRCPNCHKMRHFKDNTLRYRKHT